ncbi:MAG TPA: hypothetical protein VGC47_06305 [Acidimicrobiia bacterium]|jgi:hypothetical protein
MSFLFRHRFSAAALVLAAALAVAIPAALSAETPHLTVSGSGTHVVASGTGVGSGDIEIVFYAAADDWSSPQRQVILSQWPGSAVANTIKLQVAPQGDLQLIIHDAAGRDHAFSAYARRLGLSDGKGAWLRLQFDAKSKKGAKLTVWKSSAPADAYIPNIGWGDPIASHERKAAVSLNRGVHAPWVIGARGEGREAFRGDLYYVHLYTSGTAATGDPVIMVNFRNPKNGYETRRPYDTWANGAIKMPWRVSGSAWKYVGGVNPEPPVTTTTEPPGTTTTTKPPGTTTTTEPPPTTTTTEPPPTTTTTEPPADPPDDPPGASPVLLDTPNTAGAMDISSDGSTIVVQQTSAGDHRASLFHRLGSASRWSDRISSDPQPDLSEVIESHDGENVALSADGRTVYVAGEGSAGSSASSVYSYDLAYGPGRSVSTNDGRRSQFEYNAASLAGARDGLSGMFVSRRNPGIHWFIIDHDSQHPDGFMLFAIDSVNDRLAWRGKFEESGAAGAVSSWADVEDLSAYRSGSGTWYLEIWDNGHDEVYRFAEPSVSVGQALVTQTGLRPSRIVEVSGGAVGSGNIEAMAYNAAEDAMYWIGPRGGITSMDDDMREVRRVTNWSSRSAGAHASELVGVVVNRPG